MKKLISIFLAILCLATSTVFATTCFASETHIVNTKAKVSYLQTRRYNVGITVNKYLKQEGGPQLKIKTNSIIKSKKDKFGNITYYTAKQGTYIANVYDEGKNIGKVKIIVGNFKTTLKSNLRAITLSYNKYVAFNNSQYYSNYQSYKKVSTMISFPKKNAKYYLKTSGKSILKITNNEISTTGVGTSLYTLYQKIGNNKATKVGNFTAIVKNVKINVATAVKQNNVYNAYDEFELGDIEDLKVKTKYNLANEIKHCFLSKNCGIYINPSNYKITCSVSNSKVATVDKSGVVTGKKKGSTRFTFKITFADKSVFNSSSIFDGRNFIYVI